MAKLYFSVPYPEGAIMRLARAADEANIPSQIFQSALPAVLDTAYSRLRPGHRAPRRTTDAGHQKTSYFNGLGEVARIALRGVPRQEARRSSLMYVNAIRFDSAISQALTKEVISSSDILLGMPGASLDTFAIAKSRGIRTVLHMVNGHPRVHNEILQHHCNLPVGHHEYVPHRIETRVQDELALADVILAPSALVHTQLTTHGVDETKIKTVPYGVDTSAFQSAQRSRLESQPLNVLYVGQISYRKGIHLLLQAARLLTNNAKITLAGPLVSPDIIDNMPSNVTHIGPQSRVAIADLMRASDVFVLPSLEDACALVTAEALSSGCPVVTTTGNGSHVLIEHNLNGLVLKDVNPSTLAAAIQNGAFLKGIAEPKYVDWETYTRQVFDELNISATGYSGNNETGAGK